MIRPQRNAFRDFIDLSGLWRIRFDPDEIGEVEGWMEGIGPAHPIAVPGSWNEQLAELGFMNYVGAAWLETVVRVPEHFAGRLVGLRFASADYAADVWVNGEWAGATLAAHLPTELESAAFAPGEEARIVVRVRNVLPGQGSTQRVTLEDYAAEGRTKDEYLPAVRFDFFPYGGINRPVALTAAPQRRLLAVRLDPRIEGNERCLAAAVETRGLAAIEIKAACGEIRAFGHVAVGSGGAARLVLDLPGCPLWSPRDPRLIDVIVTGYDADGRAVDRAAFRTGMRSVNVAGDKLLLNGEALTLKGFGKHEDSPIRGRGLDLAQLVKDMALLKWCGANSVRTSHYPYAEEFYDLCDEQGILVINEAFSINLDFRKVEPAGLEAHKAEVSLLMARDYNHPCVIAWSLANEPGYLGEPEYRTRSGPYWQALFAHARAIDPHRPLTHANVSYAGNDDPAFRCADFLMINRYYGWYQAPAQLDRAIAMLEADFNALASAHGKPIFVSEFGADALAGAHSTTPQLFTEDFQADFIEAYWRAIEAHPALIGGHVWAFADFRTAQHSRRVVFNLKGVFTRDRTPKKAAWRVRTLWNQNTTP
jgi:beta-glucuronidase